MLVSHTHLQPSDYKWALHDRDGDGVSEARTRVLNMTRPAKVYDHAALLGLTVSPDGWLYVSRGKRDGRHRRPRDRQYERGAAGSQAVK